MLTNVLLIMEMVITRLSTTCKHYLLYSINSI